MQSWDRKGIGDVSCLAVVWNDAGRRRERRERWEREGGEDGRVKRES